MKQLVICIIVATSFLGCKPPKDPLAPDLGLQNPYCNDPRAVNFNWGFPGKPDNSVCIYPSEAFAGFYTLYDSVYDAQGNVVNYDNYPLSLVALSDSTLQVTGHCNPGGNYTMRATKTLQLFVDSNTAIGYTFCNGDTITGSAYKLNLNDTVVTYKYNLFDGNNVVKHIAKLIKK